MNASAKPAPRSFGWIFRYPLTLITLTGLTFASLASVMHLLSDEVGLRILFLRLGTLLSYHLLLVGEVLSGLTHSAVPLPVVVAVGLVLVFLVDHFLVRRLTSTMRLVALCLALVVTAIVLPF